ncbi:hypothetical protein Q8G35_26065 [Peribacillus simplex]|uniref:PI-PLC Y-box domain-containing protein n=2 Tax=Peribacillus TaxID=2675229 RepID=A0AA90P6S0_9BACI|nr:MULTISPECIES: hypothetical protein [Peribacillus]MDP1421735.1 hypothetical protein [Peribacillus simplex]MDP1454432.1 hypothetical protein [Peribacillus frigoritolerans]
MGKMHYKRKLVIIFIIIGTALGFYVYSAFSEKLTKSTDLSDESIGGFKVLDNISSQEFIRAYGEPIDQDNNNAYDYYYWKGGLKTASINTDEDKGKIMRLIISSTDDDLFENSLQTSKGIKLGSKKADVLSKYGDHYYKSYEQGADIIGYIDHERNITLEFWCVQGGRVAEIRLDDADVI